MKINPEEIDRMYALSGINKTALYAALKVDGAEGVKGKYQIEWRDDNPTRGYCWVVTHFVKLAGNPPPDARPYSLQVGSKKDEPLEHWYIEWGPGQWVDLTAQQFKESYSEKLPPGTYERGTPKGWKNSERVLALLGHYRKALRELGLEG